VGWGNKKDALKKKKCEQCSLTGGNTKHYKNKQKKKKGETKSGRNSFVTVPLVNQGKGHQRTRWGPAKKRFGREGETATVKNVKQRSWWGGLCGGGVGGCGSVGGARAGGEGEAPVKRRGGGWESRIVGER